MVYRVVRNGRAGGVTDKGRGQVADIRQLPYPDNSFDCVVIEAVTAFTEREKAAAEAVRATAPGGRVIDQEFVWRATPTPRDRAIFEGAVCPDSTFATADGWVTVFRPPGHGRAAGR